MNKKKNVLIIGGSSSLGVSLINSFLKKNYRIVSTYNNSKIEYDNLINGWYYKYELEDGTKQEYSESVTWIQLKYDISKYKITDIWHKYYNGAMYNNGINNDGDYAYISIQQFELDKCEQENYMMGNAINYICKK